MLGHFVEVSMVLTPQPLLEDVLVIQTRQETEAREQA